jgi:hypothetical protein
LPALIAGGFWEFGDGFVIRRLAVDDRRSSKQRREFLRFEGRNFFIGLFLLARGEGDKPIQRFADAALIVRFVIPQVDAGLVSNGSGIE